jgi:hypothetical protein
MKLVKSQNLVAKCCKTLKIYSLAKFAFLYKFVLRAEIVTIFEPKMIQNLQTLQGYIFQALQHFATKFCNFTNFIMFFLTVAFDSLLFT